MKIFSHILNKRKNFILMRRSRKKTNTSTFTFPEATSYLHLCMIFQRNEICASDFVPKNTYFSGRCVYLSIFFFYLTQMVVIYESVSFILYCVFNKVLFKKIYLYFMILYWYRDGTRNIQIWLHYGGHFWKSFIIWM